MYASAAERDPEERKAEPIPTNKPVPIEPPTAMN